MSSCTTAPPRKSIKKTYEYRRIAVVRQSENLAGDIAKAYENKKAVKKYLTSFIKKNPRVLKVTLASVPMASKPFLISMINTRRALPSPIAEYLPVNNFRTNNKLIWYREILRRKLPFWYMPDESVKNIDSFRKISYVYPVFNNLNDKIFLYVLKLDFDEKDSPVLFWDVPKRFFEQDLLAKREAIIHKYYQLKKQAEQIEQNMEADKKFKEAEKYYLEQFIKLRKEEDKRKALFKKKYRKLIDEGLIEEKQVDKDIIDDKTLEKMREEK